MVNFKKFIGTFVELKEDETKPEDTKTGKVPAQPAQNAGNEVSNSRETLHYQEMPDLKSSAGPAQEADPVSSDGNKVTLAEIETRLKKVMEAENKKNFPGADYYEFQLALENMKEVPVESAKYSSAFNVLSATQGLTKDHLVQTAQQYIGVIDREVGEFTAGFDKENKEQVDDKKSLIEDKTRQMQELSEQIVALNDEIKRLSQELVDNKNRLSSMKNSFLTVAQAQKDKINTELTKIGTYIK
jgi:uncharacterized small protein (DUF1192 family)